METQLTIQDAKILDNILCNLLDKNGLNYEELPKLDNTNRENYDTYEYYFKRLMKDELIESSVNRYSTFDFFPIETVAINFYKNGGYKQIYQDQQNEIEHQKELKELTLKKLRWDSTLSKWQRNTFWYVFIIGLVGGVCGVISLIITLNKP